MSNHKIWFVIRHLSNLFIIFLPLLNIRTKIQTNANGKQYHKWGIFSSVKNFFPSGGCKILSAAKILQSAGCSWITTTIWAVPWRRFYSHQGGGWNAVGQAWSGRPATPVVLCFPQIGTDKSLATELSAGSIDSNPRHYGRFAIFIQIVLFQVEHLTQQADFGETR